jgi:hypothetical protein
MYFYKVNVDLGRYPSPVEGKPSVKRMPMCFVGSNPTRPIMERLLLAGQAVCAHSREIYHLTVGSTPSLSAA